MLGLIFFDMCMWCIMREVFDVCLCVVCVEMCDLFDVYMWFVV